MTTQQPQPEWMEKLRHMLGAGIAKPKKVHGNRNYFCVSVGGRDHRTMLAMKDAGLVKQGRTIYSGTMQYFRATEQGCKAIGLHRAAIKRALGDT